MKIRDFINGLPLGASVITRKTIKSDLLAFLTGIQPVTTNFPLVRIGGEADGGYLVPDDLQGIDACFSPGVATIADFESQMARRGIRCFLADNSVESLPVANPLFHFEKKHLGPTNDGIYMTLGEWVRRHAPSAREMVLQMDIEGAEYPVLLECEESLLKRFRIVVIEFHALEDLWQQRGFELIRATFLKLKRHFELVHIHPNNRARLISRENIGIPPLAEFTFLRKDRVEKKSPTQSFPHPLDRPNMPAKPDLHLPACWYKTVST